MTIGLLTAGSGQTWENDLVAALDAPGAPFRVVKRCVDITDVLAEASTGQISVLVVSASLRRLDTEAVRRLQTCKVAVVGVHPASDQRAATRLDRIGIAITVPDDVGAAAMIATARTAAEATSAAALEAPPPPTTPPDAEPAPGSGSDRGRGAGSGVRGGRPAGDRANSLASDPTAALLYTQIEPPEEAAAQLHPANGRVLAVWGPTGAPGRSTLAAGLAVAAARQNIATVLVDADVYGGVLSSAFGLLDESAGLAGACRLAANGRLGRSDLTGLVWAVGPNLRLLTGITRADRWPELRPSAIPDVFQVARSMAPLVIVDCGFALESDEEISFDTLAPRRNGATLAILDDADLVLAVGSADPPGMERLVRGLAELSEVFPEVRPRVVLNRCRKSAASLSDAAEALRRFAGLDVTGYLPEDRAAADKAWQAGIPIAEAAPSSPLTAAFAQLSGIVSAAIALPV